MRKLFLLLLILICCINSQAQKNPVVVLTPNSKISDSVIVVNGYPYSHPVQRGVEEMPNPYKGMQQNMTKIGNNGRGFDLYQSAPDNMIVAKPDSSNLAITKIPNGYGIDSKNPYLYQPKWKILIDTMTGFKLNPLHSNIPNVK